MLVLVQVEFDEKEEGVDSRCDAEFIANLAARTELAKDEVDSLTGETRKVYYVYL